MGINKLNITAKRYCNKLFKPVPINFFSGEYVAVDLPIIVSSSHSKQFEKLVTSIDILNYEISEEVLEKATVRDVVSSIKKYFFNNNIKPILVMDGVAPELKTHYARIKREGVRNAAQIRFKNKLENLKSQGISFDDIEIKDLDDLIRAKLQTRRLGKNIYSAVIKALEDAGHYIVYATGEAEELCTKLCLMGKAKAVYSTDTDNIVRKCPMMITKIYYDKDNGNYTTDTISFSDEIHETIGLNYSSFLDFCIMMGCDYNNRIKRMTEWYIIEKLFLHGNIETIEEKTGQDLSSLNYKECRKLFTERPLEECCINHDELDLYFP